MNSKGQTKLFIIALKAMVDRLKIIIAFCLSIVILILIGIYTFKSINDYKDSTAYVNYSQKVITEGQKILTEIQSIESLQRGFLITGDRKYLGVYNEGLKNVKKSLSSTAILIKNDAKHQLLFDSIRVIIYSKIVFLNKVLKVEQEKGFESARQLVSTGTGEMLMNKIRTLIKKFIENENVDLSLKIINAEQKFSIIIKVIITSLSITIFIVLITLYFFLRDNKKRVYSENQLRLSNERFFKIFDKNPVAMVLSNMETSKLEYLNESFTTIFGYNPEEVIGKTSLELNLMSQDLRDKTLLRLKQQGYLKSIEGNVRKKNGDILWVLFSLEILEINEKKFILSSIYDMQDRKEMEEKISTLAEFQNIILNGTDYAIITTSHPDAIITTFNKGAEKMLGYKAEEVVGIADPSILHDATEIEARAKELSQELQMQIEPGVDVLYIKSRLSYNIDINEWTYICKNGSRISVELSISILRNKEKEIVGYLGISKDIGETKKAQEAIVSAKEAAEQSNLLKERFLANMSHEIRTPMNGIIGFTDLLLKNKLTTQQRDYVNIIKISGENLLRIINDILDVSKIESGMITFEDYPVDLREILNTLDNIFIEKAREKGLELLVKCHDNVPETILGDPTRLTQIIINLVGNAIKFTKTGGIIVFAKLKKAFGDKIYIEFEIKDTGIGISEDKLQQIFERFIQAEPHTTRSYGGTGLGLSIAKQLIELQGGIISVQSKISVGTTFTFTIPFNKIDNAYEYPLKTTQPLHTHKLKGLRILLVEDNFINIKFIESLFSAHHVSVDVAENGTSAIEKMQDKTYDIVLMDIEMPGMNGYETTTIIRERLKLDVPIIAMSAHAMSDEKEKCLNVGMNDYISKPINVEILLEKIISETSAVEKSSSENKLINFNYLMASMHGKRSAILQIINIFLKQIPADLLIIKNAIDDSDYHTIKQIAHKMKSSFSVVGIKDSDNVLIELEKFDVSEVDKHLLLRMYDILSLKCALALEEMKRERANFF